MRISSSRRARGRQDNWDYDKAVKFNDRANGLLYLWELAGPSGAHFHLFVTKTTPVAVLQEAVDWLCFQRDVVSWSWGYVPDHEREETNNER